MEIIIKLNGLRGHLTRGLRLTNVQHNKNHFTRARAVASNKQPNSYTKKRRFQTVRHRFIFPITELQKSYSSFKNTKIMDFEKIKTFFCICVCVKRFLVKMFLLCCTFVRWRRHIQAWRLLDVIYLRNMNYYIHINKYN